LSGRGLCDGLIIRPEESYRLWCVCVCVCGWCVWYVCVVWCVWLVWRVVCVCVCVLRVGRNRLSVFIFNPTKVQRESTSSPIEHKSHVSIHKTHCICSVSTPTATNHIASMCTAMAPSNAPTVGALHLVYIRNKLLHVSASRVAIFRDVK
jgi:hypothetical protein